MSTYVNKYLCTCLCLSNQHPNDSHSSLARYLIPTRNRDELDVFVLMDLLCKIPNVESCVETSFVVFRDGHSILRFCQYIFVLHLFITIRIPTYVHCLSSRVCVRLYAFMSKSVYPSFLLLTLTDFIFYHL